MTAPRLESTVAALAFNRLAQETLRSTSALASHTKIADHDPSDGTPFVHC
jgi:hypothetical protein